MEISCDWCGRAMWRAPGRAFVQLTDDGIASAPLVMPDVTVWLCVVCGLAARAGFRDAR